MKNMKKIISLFLSLMVSVTALSAFPVQADTSSYVYHTQVGESFSIPTEDGVIWQTASVDTSVMGRRILEGKDTDGNAVKGIVNVGVRKYSSYQNNQGKTVGNEIGYKLKDEWVLAAQSGNASNPTAKYAVDPACNENTVVSLTPPVTNGGNQINYEVTNTIAENTSFSVEFRIKTPLTEQKGDNYQIRFLGTATGSSTGGEIITIERLENGYKFKLNNGTGVSDTTLVAGQWMDLKYVENIDEKKSYLYVNGQQKDSQNVKLESNVDSALNGDGFKMVDFKYKTKAASDFPTCYLDDVKVTDLSTTDYIYYGDVSTTSQKEFLQSNGTQKISLNQNVALVDKDGNESGWTVPIFASATADLSKLGSFSQETAIAGFDEPLSISWKVYKEQYAWGETFDGYEDSDIGKAPHLEPFQTGTGYSTEGLTVQYDPKSTETEAENKKQVLRFQTNKKTDKAVFSDNTSIDGKVRFSYRFMVPEIYSTGSFALPINGSGYKGDSTQSAGQIDLNILFSSKGGRVYFKKYNTSTDGSVSTVTSPISDGTQDIIAVGQLQANQWYTLSFLIDQDTDTFTYSLDGTECAETFCLTYSNLTFRRMDLRQTTDDLSSDVTLYLDDIKAEKVLTLQKPIDQSVTVYKGDTVTLPSAVEVLLTDGQSRASADVQWNGTLDTTGSGTASVTGRVTGTDKPVTLTATISNVPYEIVAPVLKNGNTEVFGLLGSACLTAVSVNKIAEQTLAATIYAALYDEDDNLLKVATAGIDTAQDWSRGTTKDLTVSLPLAVGDGINIDTCKLKIFIFSDGLQPYALAHEMKNTVSGAAPTVWIAGDSTAARYVDSRRPETGWAEQFAWTYTAGTAGVDDNAHLNNSDVLVQNGTANGIGGVSGTGAIGGQSSKSYVDQGRLEKILDNAKAGDYLFIQFGHNDSGSEAYRHTEPNTTYKEYMTTFVTEARKKGVIPVIFTSIVRGVYSDGSFIGDTKANLDEYAAAAKEVAAEYHVPMVDLFTATGDVLKTKTAENSQAYFLYLQKCTGSSNEDCVNEINGEKNHALWCKNYSEGSTDSTHLNHYGAKWVAGLAYEGLCDIKLPLVKYLAQQ